MKDFFTEKYSIVLFVLLLLAMGYCGVYEMLFMRPFGIHVIRQTDCLSIVSDYFHHQSSFFQPSMYNLGYSDGKGLSEFPIFYYLTAMIYKVIGEHEYVLRLLHLSICVWGFVSLTKMIHRILNHAFYAIVLSLLFSSSTVLLFYSANFLPEIPALGFTLIGWEKYVNYRQHNGKWKLLWACIFMCLAGLLKISFLIHFGTIAIIEMAEWMQSRKSTIAVPSKNLLIIPLLGITVVFTWWLFVIQYNQDQKQTYYLLQMMPIWRLSSAQIVAIWDYITRYWWGNLYYYSTFHLFLLIILVWLIRLKYWKGFVSKIAVIGGLGALSYFVLFFAQFKDHDYYFIVMMPALFWLVIDGVRQMLNSYPKQSGHIIAKLILVVICILSINYAKLGMSRRLISENQEISKDLNQLDGIRSWLVTKNVAKDALFIVFGDQTHNGSLYFMNRKGWQIKHWDQSGEKVVRKALSSGAEYVLMFDSNFVKNVKATIPNTSLVGTFGGKEIRKILNSGK